MSAILAAFFGGLGWRGWVVIAAALALLTGIYLVRSADREAGAAAERARIEAANRASETQADAAERRVLECRGTWVRGEGCKQ